jgi:hypothetical protein
MVEHIANGFATHSTRSENDCLDFFFSHNKASRFF